MSFTRFIKKFPAKLHPWENLPIEKTPVDEETLHEVENTLAQWPWEAEAGIRKSVEKAIELETKAEYKEAYNEQGDIVYAEDTKSIWAWNHTAKKWEEITTSYFRGSFPTLAALEAETSLPEPATGDVALVEETNKFYYYNAGWKPVASGHWRGFVKKLTEIKVPVEGDVAVTSEEAEAQFWIYKAAAWHAVEIHTENLVAEAVISSKIAGGAVTESKIGPEAVIEAKLSSAVAHKLLGTTAAEGLKELTKAEAETGIEPSSTRAALVTVSAVIKNEVTTYKVEANGVVVQELKLAATNTSAGNIVPLGTFLVNPGKKIKLTKTAGEIEKGHFSVQLMN